MKHAKVLRQAGLKVDDDLTRLQQQERKSFGDDFAVLKAKGHNPFFRGSQLHVYTSESTQIGCRPAERAKQAQSHQLMTNKPRAKALLKLLLTDSTSGLKRLLKGFPRADPILLQDGSRIPCDSFVFRGRCITSPKTWICYGITVLGTVTPYIQRPSSCREGGFTSFGQPTRLIACASYGNHLRICS